MKIFIAGSWLSQGKLRPMADALRAMGHTITSRWLYEAAQPPHFTKQEFDREVAFTDIADVAAADCIVLDRSETSTSGGRYVEWGVACAPGAHMRRYTVGGKTFGIYDSMAHRHFESWDDLLAYFAMRHATR